MPLLPLPVAYLIVGIELVAIAYSKYSMTNAGRAKTSNLIDIGMATFLLIGIYFELGMLFGILVFTVWTAIYFRVILKIDEQLQDRSGGSA